MGGIANDTLIRTTLSAAEWARIKRIARKRDLPASRLVAHKLRELIDEDDAERKTS